MICEALDSVARQHVPDVAVFVVDDCSRDPLDHKHLSSFYPNVRVVRNASVEGIAQSRNRGAKLGKNPFLSFLDSDDLWAEGALTSLFREAKLSEADMVFGAVEHFLDKTDAEPTISVDTPSRTSVAMAGSSLIRRATFEALGGFSDSIEMGEFIDFASRLSSRGFLTTEIPQLVLRRRIHSGNYSRLSRQAATGYLAVVRRHMMRRNETR
jgi:glycosyltransferase involved in cell wall biosynthesis